MKKRVFTIFTLVLMLFVLVSCGEYDDTNDDTNYPLNNETYYTVKFNGVNLQEKKVIEGGKLSKPSAPDKNGYLFMGWFYDSEYNNQVSFPLTINNDIVLYGKYSSLDTIFLEARENTIGNEISSFEYDYIINASASALSQSFTGTVNGNTKYNQNSIVTYYDVHENSGILFNDGYKYKIKKGNQLQTISLDENGNMIKFENELVDSSFKCDFGSFAKALFSYSDSDIKSIEQTNVSGKYKVNTKVGASDVIALIGNNLNNPIVEHLICPLPATEVKTDMYVTFNNDKIDTYTYEIRINVSVVEFYLEYTLQFKNINNVSNIIVKEFDNVALSTDTIKNQKDIVYGHLNEFINQKSSGYNYKLTTGIDHGYTSLEINSTFNGSSYRNIIDDEVYFHNHIEIDSDYKNNDVYKNVGITDVEVKKTKLANGDVYLIEKKLLADKVNSISDYIENDYDSYFLYNAYSEFNNITFIQTKTDGDKTIYSLGIAQEDVVSLLIWMNNNLDLDPLNNATANVSIFGEFNENSVIVDKVLFEVTITDGQLSMMRIVCEGQYETCLIGSKDFAELKSAVFDFDLTIIVDEDGYSFAPYTSINEAK